MARAVGLLGSVSGDLAAREARMILGAATGWSAARVAVAAGEVLEAPVLAAAEAMLARRLAREPMAQIMGQWAFYGRAFLVTRDTLTPRPDTETLVELALSENFERLLDLGTGTGAIAVSLLAERPEATGIASDISAAALAVAAENAARHGVAGRMGLVQADWWEGIAGRFGLIVSNPPYVSVRGLRGGLPRRSQAGSRAAP